MTRAIVLDTETTGLDAKSGHRLIEIACVEIVDSLPTGKHFHQYVQPDRPIDAEAERVHGISAAFLKDRPRFHEPEVCAAFLEFVGDAPLIAHNASFDRSFINMEMKLAGRPPIGEPRWIDTLALAQKKFPGAVNSLNALCKRFKISLDEREKHGALIDAKLLAAVYLELQGGRERSLDLNDQVTKPMAPEQVVRIAYGPRPRALVQTPCPLELEAHNNFVEKLGSGSVWKRLVAADLA